MTIDAGTLRAGADRLQEEAVAFLREMIRTPSMSGQEQDVIALIAGRMRAVGFDEVRIDPFGNLWGRIGSGSRILAFDAHVDTVAVGDRALWQVDPFGAEMVDGIIYGRGAADQKAGMAALVYAGALLKQLAFEGDITLWFVGSVLEEDCDGLCWHYILNEKLMRPDLVVLTEPTNLQVYRGQRGRLEMEVTLKGRACHGSAPERGINAIHRMGPVLAAIEALPAEFARDPFLGPGSITTSQIRSSAPSLCAVADECTIHLDRRLTAGETDATALGQVRAILDRLPLPGGEPRVALPADEIVVPIFERASYTGRVYPMRQYFPAWVLPEEDRRVKLALRARGLALGDAGRAGAWTFSTNGVATMGIHGVPTLGFGPADEIHAHAPSDQCPAAHLGSAMTFYATLAVLAAQEEWDDA